VQECVSCPLAVLPTARAAHGTRRCSRSPHAAGGPACWLLSAVAAGHHQPPGPGGDYSLPLRLMIVMTEMDD
jgi:hypothetical protein